MGWKRRIRDFFIPSLQNQLRPYSLRYKTLVFIVVFSATLELAFFAYVNIAFKQNVLLGNIITGIQSTVADVLPDVIINETNSYRIALHEKPLEANSTLTLAAKMKAEDMANRGYFSHQSPDGRMAWDWMERAGYNYSYAGENLAVNFFDARDIVRAWMDSPSHRENILNGQFSQVGIGVARGSFEGKQTVFVVQMFGTPAAPDESYRSYALTPQNSDSQKPHLNVPRIAASSSAGSKSKPRSVAVLGGSAASGTPVYSATSASSSMLIASGTVAASASSSAPRFISRTASLMVSPRHVIRDVYTILIIYILLSLAIPMYLIFRHHQSPDIILRLREIVMLFRNSIVSSFVTLLGMTLLLFINYWWAMSGTDVFTSAIGQGTIKKPF